MKFATVCAALALAAGCCSQCETHCSSQCDASCCEAAVQAPGAEEGAVALKPGEKYVITLEENMTTGFSWDAVVEGDCVSATVEHMGPPETDMPLCGAPGSASVTIAAKDGLNGVATVTLSYRRPWEGGETAETRKIKVVVL